MSQKYIQHNVLNNKTFIYLFIFFWGGGRVFGNVFLLFFLGSPYKVY